MSFGHRVVQVWQPAQTQIVLDRRSSSSQAELDHAHDLVGHHVHGEGQRAAVGTLAALVAPRDVLAAAGLHHAEKGTIRLKDGTDGHGQDNSLLAPE